MDLPLTLDALEELIRNASPEKIKAIEAAAGAKAKALWVPQPGKQSDAYYSKADELLYGGAAGGGKTDLLIGLATTSHQRSVIFRSQSVDLAGLWERLVEVVPNPSHKDASRKAMRLADNRVIETGHLDLPGSERAWMGRPHDLIGFDEAALLDELKVNFVLQWLRSTDPKQRKRVVMATNPPIPEIRDGVMTDTPVGDWLLRWFAPWVDELHPKFGRVAEGELLWCFMRAEGDRLVTVWVDGPGHYNPITSELVPVPTEKQLENGDVAAARSRTFIRSLVSDNTFLKGTGYVEKLSGTPEPLKSMLLRGDFTIKGADHPFQIIPTQWVLAAQQRWQERPWEEVKRLRQLVLYTDVAQGGADTTVLAPLYETDYYDELITEAGDRTPTGEEVMVLLLLERLDNSMLVADGTGGWAGSTRDLLKTLHNIDVEMHVVSKTDGSYTPDMIYQYANLRAKMWWEFRLALDPKSGYEICLPPSARLRAQLTAPHWKPKGKVLFVEEKDEIRKRIGSSTDEADAVLGAWQYRDQAIANITDPVEDFIEKINGRSNVKNFGQPLPLESPIKTW